MRLRRPTMRHFASRRMSKQNTQRHEQRMIEISTTIKQRAASRMLRLLRGSSIKHTTRRKKSPTRSKARTTSFSCTKTNLRSERSEEHTSELQSHVNLVCRL